MLDKYSLETVKHHTNSLKAGNLKTGLYHKVFIYEGWLKIFALLYEIIKTGRSAVYHCKDILVSISNMHMSCVGWHVTNKLVRTWVSCVWSRVKDTVMVCYVIKFLNLQYKAANQIYEIYARQISHPEFTLPYRCRELIMQWATIVFHDNTSYIADPVFCQLLFHKFTNIRLYIDQSL